MSISEKSKRNLIILVILVFAILLLLIFRLGWIQIVQGQEYSERLQRQNGLQTDHYYTVSQSTLQENFQTTNQQQSAFA